MHEAKPIGMDEGLACPALRYARGELDPGAEAAFESRLGEDQQARDALAQAVSKLLEDQSQEISFLDRSYRDAVHRRLRPSSTPWHWLLEPRRYRGHPIAWSMLGAAASFLFLVAYSGSPAMRSMDMSLVKMPIQKVPELSQNPEHSATVVDAATIWAEMGTTDHLLRAHDEEILRKNRLEKEQRISRSDERRLLPARHYDREY